VAVFFITGREGKRGGNRSKFPYLLGLSLQRRLGSRASSGGCAWRRRAATVPASQGFLSTAPQSQKPH